MAATNGLGCSSPSFSELPAPTTSPLELPKDTRKRKASSPCFPSFSSLDKYGERVAPKLHYPSDWDYTRGAAQRRRLHQIKRQTKVCLSIFDVQVDIMQKEEEMGKGDEAHQQMCRRITQRLETCLDQLDVLCQASIWSFCPGGDHGPPPTSPLLLARRQGFFTDAEATFDAPVVEVTPKDGKN